MRRDRLLEPLAQARLALIEAPSGFGKSVLVAEHGRRLAVAIAITTLGPGSTGPAELVAGLRRALLAVHLSDLAAALDGGGREPAALLDSLLDSLAAAREPVLLALDDAHELSGEAARLIVHLGQGLPHQHRFVIAARRLPRSVERLALLPGAVRFGGAELAFSDGEAAALITRAGVELPPATAAALCAATGGWAAALVMVAALLARAHDPEREAARLLQAPSAAPAVLLEDLLDGLAVRERAAIDQLGHLPLLSPAVVEAAIEPGGFDSLLALGLPLTRTAGGWWALPGPIAEHLRGRAPLAGAVARAVADSYAVAGELRLALRTLIAGGEHERAARRLEQLTPLQVDALGCAEVEALIGALSDEAARAHPGALLHLARLAEADYQGQVRVAALTRLERLAGDAGFAGRWRNELDAERARELLWNEPTRAQAQQLAEAVLARAGPEEMAARARALDVLGRARCWLIADGPREQAEPLLAESARLARQLGAATWAAQALVPLAWGVHFALGRYERALATLDEALAELPARSRYRAQVQTWRAEALIELGRPLEAQVSLEEIRDVGRVFGEEWALAFAAWAEARAASYAGDRAQTVELVLEVERHRDPWFDGVGGLEFLAHAADLLDRVGEHELAQHYLGRAQAHAAATEHPHRTSRPISLFSAMVAGRSGEPDKARRQLDAMLARVDTQPQERWHLELLEAHAVHRAGDARAGALAAAAFEHCSALGYPEAALTRERDVSIALLPLAAAAGSRAAAALLRRSGELSVTLFGGFEVRRSGRPVQVPEGLPATIVRAVAAHGGRLHSEQLIELLWPDANVDAARNRLRNALSRLRAAAGQLITREGSLLVLAPPAAIDLEQFEQVGAEALALRAAGERGRAAVVARGALGRHRGEILPEERYADWAEAIRERVRSLVLELLDLAIDDAERQRDVDEAVRLLDRAIRVQPGDERRYVRLAQLLESQGRAGSARAVLRRARARLAELGPAG